MLKRYNKASILKEPNSSGTAEVTKNNIRLKQHKKALVQGIHEAIGDPKTLNFDKTYYPKMTK